MQSFKFEEQQKFKQRWMYIIYILLLALLAMFCYAGIQQIYMGKPFGAKPAPDLVFVLSSILIMTLLITLCKIKLETIITVEAIYFRWRPFGKAYTRLSWSYIDKAQVIKYSFVGYGLRLTPNGTVYNVGGDTGLKIEMKCGKKIIIGTQKPKQLEDFLKQINRFNLKT